MRRWAHKRSILANFPRRHLQAWLGEAAPPDLSMTARAFGEVASVTTITNARAGLAIDEAHLQGSIRAATPSKPLSQTPDCSTKQARLSQRMLARLFADQAQRRRSEPACAFSPRLHLLLGVQGYVALAQQQSGGDGQRRPDFAKVHAHIFAARRSPLP